MTTFATSVGRRFRAHYFVGTTLFIALAMWTLTSGVDVAYLIEPGTLIWLAGFLIASLWYSFGPVEVVRAIRVALARPGISINRQSVDMAEIVLARSYRLAWAAGVLNSMFSVVVMLSNMSDPWLIGPGMGWASLGILYGGLAAEFVFAPLHVAVCKRRVMSGK